MLYKAENLEETMKLFNSNTNRRTAAIRLDPYKWFEYDANLCDKPKAEGSIQS